MKVNVARDIEPYTNGIAPSAQCLLQGGCSNLSGSGKLRIDSYLRKAKINRRKHAGSLNRFSNYIMNNMVLTSQS